MQKVFEVYLLLSRRDRLASGDLGMSLIIFQLLELLSCVLIGGIFMLVKCMERKARRSSHTVVGADTVTGATVMEAGTGSDAAVVNYPTE